MIWIDKIGTELFAWCFAFSLVAILAALYGKQFLAWLIMKLYELFIGSRDHIIIT